jgi:hypothetical protein
LGGSESCAKSTGGGDSVHVRFVSFERADEPGSRWQLERNMILNHEKQGVVIVDTIRGLCLGGVQLSCLLVKIPQSADVKYF